jgi:hypothetical protein
MFEGFPTEAYYLQTFKHLNIQTYSVLAGLFFVY